MPFFTSAREKRLWIWALVVLAAIFSTLFIGQPLVRLFSNQDTQAVFFAFGMLLVGVTIGIHAFKTKPSKFEWTILIGLVAVYLFFFLRLGLTERSHLLEYSVLAIFIHKAMVERVRPGKQVAMLALVSFAITFAIGALDECIQIIIPDRVFDPVDIFFNGMAAATAIGAHLILAWGRKRWGKN